MTRTLTFFSFLCIVINYKSNKNEVCTEKVSNFKKHKTDGFYLKKCPMGEITLLISSFSLRVSIYFALVSFISGKQISKILLLQTQLKFFGREKMKESKNPDGLAFFIVVLQIFDNRTAFSNYTLY